MVICVLATVTIALTTTTVLMTAQDNAFQASLSDSAISAQAALRSQGVPSDTEGLRELVQKQQQLYGGNVLDNGVLLGVAVASIVFGGLVGVLLARRLGGPLGDVSQAAKRVASGDLSARAPVGWGAAGEALQLVENFNAMAESLEKFQRRSVESAAAVAHELRTPLTILRGRLQGMQEGLFSTEKKDIGHLIRQVDALSQIVSDLNTVSLAQAGQLRMHFQEIDLAEEVAVLLDSVSPELQNSGLKIIRELEGALTEADADRVRQVALALVDNARQHASSGGQIKVNTRIRNDSAILEVTDWGPGVTEEALGKVFEPFWRPDNSRSRDSGGTGLGLSVVAAIAQAHDGQAVVLPNPEGGAVFRVSFPRKASSSELHHSSSKSQRNLHRTV